MRFAPLNLQLGASDFAGAGEDYHISSRRKGWTWLLVVPTLESPKGHERAFSEVRAMSAIHLNCALRRIQPRANAMSVLHRFEHLGGVGMHVELCKLVAAHRPDVGESGRN